MLDTNELGWQERTKTGHGELSTQKGAMRLAKRLEAYWRAHGYDAARFWAEPVAERFKKIGTYEIYRVASNLVNGLPPRHMPAGTEVCSA